MSWSTIPRAGAIGFVICSALLPAIPGRRALADGGECALVAERVLLASREAGIDEALGQELARVALEACLDVAAMVAPGPCELRCESAAWREYERCVAGGGDPDACREASAGLLGQCLDGCASPPPPECPDRCHLAFEERLRLCEGMVGEEIVGEDGVVLDVLPEECLREAEEELDRCLRSCDGDPAPTCQERCDRLESELLAECVVGPEGDVVSEECLARIEAEVAACRDACDAPPPPECPDRCHLAFEERLRRCEEGMVGDDGEPVEEGDDPDVRPEECFREAERALERCMVACDVDPDPDPDPDPETDCPDACQRKLEAYLERCQSVDDPAAIEECLARADEILSDCLLACDGGEGTDPEDPAEPPPCDLRCEPSARLVLRECLAEGGDPGECEARMLDYLASCAEDCGGERPKPITCDEACASEAESLLARCIEAGGDPRACAERADLLLETCLARCDREPPDTCDSRCGALARELLAACVEEGLDAAECRRRVNDELEACLADCGGDPADPPEDPLPCDERCALHAERLLAECVERGGEPDACQARVAEYLEGCASRCAEVDAGGDGEGDDAACPPSECASAAARVRRECLADGGSEADCDAAAEEFLAHCEEPADAACAERTLALEVGPATFRRGDFNRDDRVDISDAVGVLGHLFLGVEATRCEDAADADDNGTVNLTDAISILGWLFQGAGELPAPGCFRAGQDPTSDDLICWP